MATENINDLFIEELKNILDAEHQITKGLPNLIKASESPELKDALSGHLKETEGQVERLNKIFSLLKIKPQTTSCKAMKGLIDECDAVVKEFSKSALRDAAIIAKAQRIEHYEIATYGTLKSFATELGLIEITALLKTTLDQESAADKKLTKIAEGSLLTAGINSEANSK